MTGRPPSSERWTSHSMRSTPSSIADLKDASVFSGHSSGLPRWPPSNMRPPRNLEPSVSARAIVIGQCYVNRREIFTFPRHTQEISETAVTPATVSARAGRLSHDLTQDPVAGASTEGAGAGDRAARAIPGDRAGPSVHAGAGEGSRRGRAGPGRDQLQPGASRLSWPRLSQRIQTTGGHAFSGHSAQLLLGPGR